MTPCQSEVYGTAVGDLTFGLTFIITPIKIREVNSTSFNTGSTHVFPGTLASFCGGFAAGVVTNPVDIVYNRQAADALLPNQIRRNYTSFLDGLIKVNAEGALFRGSIASGWSYGMLLASMSYLYDYLKEYMYWIFGPTSWIRPLTLLPTAYVGTLLYLPFDNIKVRYHTMTAMPDGSMPYKRFVHTVLQVIISFKYNQTLKYEASLTKFSSLIAYHNGGVPAFWKLYINLFIVLII